MDEILFECDNGMISCQKHLGFTAQTTGRDLSGKKIRRVTKREREEWIAEFGQPMACEDCDSKRKG